MDHKTPQHLLRMADIVGDRKKGIAPLVPIGRSTLLDWEKQGKFPKSFTVGVARFWRYKDVMRWIELDGRWEHRDQLTGR